MKIIWVDESVERCVIYEGHRPDLYYRLLVTFVVTLFSFRTSVLAYVIRALSGSLNCEVHEWTIFL